ncbi:MAG: YopX family protein [Schleiferilactobacillus perolens]|uniref:YopX family protein n=1 Tax=Schleiferilactobacillus perolens TaxID=100468 RepID=UPI0039E9887A
MKREIKFKAYRKSTQNVCDVLSIDFEKGWVLLDDGDEEDIPTVELMQYTGLHDKNGREIYEGDIVDFGLENQDGKLVLAPVSYGEYIAGYVLDNGGNGIWQRLTKDCKVIGNIYENPDLLEAQHD